jgi:hypothetical protein
MAYLLVTEAFQANFMPVVFTDSKNAIELQPHRFYEVVYLLLEWKHVGKTTRIFLKPYELINGRRM